MAAEQIPLTWLLRKRTPGKPWSEWIVCGKADFDAIKAKPLHWGMEYEAVAVVALAGGVAEPFGGRAAWPEGAAFVDAEGRFYDEQAQPLGVKGGQGG